MSDLQSTVTLTLSLKQLLIIDSGLCLIDDISTAPRVSGGFSIPDTSHGKQAMALRDSVLVPAINSIAPGHIDA